MTHKVQSLRERRAQRTRDDLIEATIDVISSSTEVTVELILRASGVSRATLYTYFPGGRDELLRVTYDQIGNDLLVRARSAVNKEGSWIEQITSFAQTFFELSTDTRLGFFYNITGPHLLGFRAERGIGSQGYYAHFLDQLRRGSAVGAISEDLDLEATATLLSGSLRDAAIDVSKYPDRGHAYLASFRKMVSGLEAIG